VGSDGTFILANAFQIGHDDIGRTFELTASSGSQTAQAAWVFTDSPKVVSVTVGSQSPASVVQGSDAIYVVSVSRDGANDDFTASLSITTSIPGQQPCLIPFS